MAFVRIDAWQPAMQSPMATSRFVLAPQLHDALWGTRIRRLLTLSATIILHITAFWLVMSARAPVDPVLRKSGMTLINISDGDAPKEGRAEVDDSPAPSTEQRPADPSEWSITRIQVALPLSEPSPVKLASVARATPLVEPSQATVPGNASGAASAGGGFDPYAGSAPNWQQSAPAFRAVAQTRSCFAFAPPGATKQLAKIRSKLTLPSFLASMPMRIRLTLDDAGRVTAVDPPATLADAASRDRLIRMFNGKKVRAQVPIDADPKCAFVSF